MVAAAGAAEDAASVAAAAEVTAGDEAAGDASALDAAEGVVEDVVATDADGLTLQLHYQSKTLDSLRTNKILRARSLLRYLRTSPSASISVITTQ